MLVSLGSWQLYRLNWKLDLISQIEDSLKNSPVKLSNIDRKNYLRIKTSGNIDFEKQIYLYNLNNSGKPGFEVINPILIGNENYLINSCLLYTSDAADERLRVDLGGRRIIKKRFFSSRRRHTRCSWVSWARRCV